MKPPQGFLGPTARASHFWSPKLWPELRLGWLAMKQSFCGQFVAMVFTYGLHLHQQFAPTTTIQRQCDA